MNQQNPTNSLSETPPEKIIPVLRNISKSSAFYNDLYQEVGENRYRNLRTGQEGEVPADKAKEVFVINITASRLFSSCPLLYELVGLCDLKINLI